jgi:hypothetical protein
MSRRNAGRGASARPSRAAEEDLPQLFAKNSSTYGSTFTQPPDNIDFADQRNVEERLFHQEEEEQEKEQEDEEDAGSKPPTRATSRITSESMTQRSFL